MAETAKWYVVHTYSAYENTVKATLEKTVETRTSAGLRSRPFPSLMETVTEITENGASKTIRAQGLPRLRAGQDGSDSDETWYVVKNVRGATGFVGDFRQRAHRP